MPTHRRSWVAAPHESQAHGSPVSNETGNETQTREWLAALSETAGSSRARTWLQPEACAQPTTNRSPARKGVRAWMEPSATVEPQAKHQRNIGSQSWLEPSATVELQAKHQRSSGSRSWLEPSATAEPQAKRQCANGSRSWSEPSVTAEPQVKRQHMPGAEVQCPESSVRHMPQLCL